MVKLISIKVYGINMFSLCNQLYLDKNADFANTKQNLDTVYVCSAMQIITF